MAGLRTQEGRGWARATLHGWDYRRGTLSVSDNSRIRGIGQKREEWDTRRALEDTHSTYLVQGGGSCWAMKTQLVRMVHMMSMLKSVAPVLRKLREGY